jgi:hypothetical protein
MRITVLFRSLITCISCFAVFSCNKINSDRTFEFYYYPAKNIYYDVSNARYLYSLDGGRNWDTLQKKMDKEPLTLGNKQIIYSGIRTPWDSNEVHRKLYGGYLLDIINAEDSSALQKDVVAERKLPGRSKPRLTTANNKNEKKPGFFKRLFGKKH